jgi:hypothetical protein
MSENKIDFISDLLGSKKIEPSQKERVFMLAAYELKKNGETDEKIFAEIEEIKNQLVEIKLKGLEMKNDHKGSDGIDQAINDEIDLLKHRPIETSQFLQSFSSDSNPLKYLIHDKTDGFEFTEIIKEWNKKLNKYYDSNVKFSLRTRIFYLIGTKKNEKDWYFNGVKQTFKYSNKTVSEWCSKNPNTHPIHHFEKEISIFKKSIKLYDGALKTHFIKIMQDVFGTQYSLYDIELIDLEKAELYTDVDALISGLKSILNSIKQRSKNGKKIKIVFEAKATSQGRTRIIKIIHVNSKCDRILDKSELFGTENGGDFKDAEKRFFQICDWSIISHNLDPNFNKLNILFDINKNIPSKQQTPLDGIDGFTHLLTFYS